MRILMRLVNRSALPKERREDPFVVAIDPVIGDHRVTLTPAGDSEEGAGRAGRVVLATRGAVGRFSVQHVGHLRNQSGQLSELGTGSWRRTTAVNGQGANQSGKIL